MNPFREIVTVLIPGATGIGLPVFPPGSPARRGVLPSPLLQISAQPPIMTIRMTVLHGEGMNLSCGQAVSGIITNFAVVAIGYPAPAAAVLGISRRPWERMQGYIA